MKLTAGVLLTIYDPHDVLSISILHRHGIRCVRRRYCEAVFVRMNSQSGIEVWEVFVKSTLKNTTNSTLIMKLAADEKDKAHEKADQDVIHPPF